MILSDGRYLQAKLAGAPSTTQPMCIASYEVWGRGNKPDHRTVDVACNSTTAVNLTGAPSDGVAKVLHVGIYNADTSSVVVTVQLAGGTQSTPVLFKATLATLERVEYTPNTGWVVKDATGAIKQTTAAAAGVVQTTDVAITVAEMKAIYTTPKTLVAAPGAGYVNEFLGALLIMDYSGGAFTTNGILGIYETNAAGTLLSNSTTLASFLGLTADAMIKFNPVQTTADTVGKAYLANKALVLTCAAADPASAAGTSSFRIYTSYRTWATGL